MERPKEEEEEEDVYKMFIFVISYIETHCMKVNIAFGIRLYMLCLHALVFITCTHCLQMVGRVTEEIVCKCDKVKNRRVYDESSCVSSYCAGSKGMYLYEF